MSLVHNYCLHFHAEILSFKHFCDIFFINQDLWMSKNQTTLVDIFGNGHFLLSFILGALYNWRMQTLRNASNFFNWSLISALKGTQQAQQNDDVQAHSRLERSQKFPAIFHKSAIYQIQ